MTKNVLLTGGTGFLGSHLAKKLQSLGHKVSLYTRVGSSHKRLEPHAHDFKYITSLDDLEANYDFLFHLATCYGRNGESDNEICAVNKDLATNIVSRIFHDSLEIFLAGTSCPPELNTYSKMKWELFEELQKYDPKHILIEHFYGPEDNSFIGFVVKMLRKNTPEIDFTEGTQKRDFIYYKDVIDAFIFLFENPGKLTGNIPLGQGKEFQIREVVEKIKAFFPAASTKFNWGVIPFRDNEVMSSIADLSILKKAGWEPKFSLETGLSDFLL